MATTAVAMSCETITQIVCDYFGVDIEAVKGRGRAQLISVPRKIACYMMRQVLPISYEDIGTWMGLRDHSTIMYCVRDIEKRAKSSTMMQLHLRAIELLMQEQHAGLQPETANA